MRDDRLYLKDILDAIESITAFVQGMSQDDFQADDKTSSAVMRKFEIIGEATKQMSEQTRSAHPHIPWKEMAGMRDKLIHAYFGIDYELVWTSVKERLPQVKSQIQKVLEGH